VHSRRELIELLNHRHITLRGEKIELLCSKEAEFVPFDMDLGQKLLDIFVSPSTSYMLFLLGAALLYFEFQASTSFLAGGVGAFCLILAGIGFQVVPINLGAFGLLVLSLVFFILEAFVASFGLLAIAGLLSLIAGSLFLFRSDQTYLDFSVSFIVGAVTSIGLFMLSMGLFIWRDRRHKRRFADYYSLVGKSATVVARLPNDLQGNYCYQIKIEGEVWQASSSEHHSLGSSCVVRAESEDSLSLRI
jgi:membrane-bound serine protease (ClpP class)